VGDERCPSPAQGLLPSHLFPPKRRSALTGIIAGSLHLSVPLTRLSDPPVIPLQMFFCLVFSLALSPTFRTRFGHKHCSPGSWVVTIGSALFVAKVVGFSGYEFVVQVEFPTPPLSLSVLSPSPPSLSSMRSPLRLPPPPTFLPDIFPRQIDNAAHLAAARGTPFSYNYSSSAYTHALSNVLGNENKDEGHFMVRAK